MGLNTLLILEDFCKDQFVAKPLIRRIFEEIGRPHAHVEICRERMGGISEALKWERIEEVIEMYPMVGIFLLLVDRDGNKGRRQALDKLEERSAAKLRNGRVLFGENAWQEVEVWALAGQQPLPDDWAWQRIRSEVHPKEVYFEPMARERGLLNEPGEGRTTMGREAAQNYDRVRSRCPEDIQALEIRLRAWLEAG